MKAGKIFLAFVLGIVLLSGFALATPEVTNEKFTTNYTISASSYAKGGSTVTFNVTVGNVDAIPGTTLNSNSNVSVIVNNQTDNTVATVYLANESTTGNGTWSGTWLVTDTDQTSGNFTFNASDNTSLNASEIIQFKIDATDPTVSSLIATQTIKGRTGMTKALTGSVTDGISIGSCTLTITAPTGSSESGGGMTLTGTSTSKAGTYTATLDKYGTYTLAMTCTDTVTNSGTDTTTNVITFRKRETSDDDGGVIPSDLEPFITPPSEGFNIFSDIEIPSIDIGGWISSAIDFFLGISSAIFGN